MPRNGLALRHAVRGRTNLAQGAVKVVEEEENVARQGPGEWC